VRWAEIALGEGTGNNAGVIHYYLAVNLGLAIQEHIALAMRNLSRLSAELEQACALAPDEDQGGPYRVMGMLYFRAPPWPQGIGDEEKALELLSKAAKKYPGHPLNHLFYAKVLWAIEEEDALPKVEKHLAQAYQLLQNGSWGEAGPRWLKELTELAGEAKLTMPSNPQRATN
jgi:tetratricopeptide (TPR) repeat protein